ncbi:tyrosine-type recombinase/integrase [Streptomyces sp. NPDC059477]|uniref:tyrosine-type recombinase/integrase n=1 Tax=Streptomyces sp. NPDC059477 TaxID=3346847 RepID=UPI0036B3ED86
MVHRGPPASGHRRQPRGLAVRARDADRLPAHQLPLHRLPQGPGPGRRAGLPLLPKVLRVTHLIEDGWDPRFVQEQVGHEHASTTSIYTCVSSDFRTRTLRRHLDATVAALQAQNGKQA